MGGVVKSGGIYEEDVAGKQVYLHCWFQNRGQKARLLTVSYVGCGRAGRPQQVSERQKTPAHGEWLQQHWIGRTVLFAKPRRLEDLSWLESVLIEYGCREGLVIIETPFLKNADKVEARLIEIYQNHPLYNKNGGRLPAKQFKPMPNHSCLKNHAADIRQRKAAGEATNALAREFGVDPSSIRYIIRGDSYKDVA